MFKAFKNKFGFSLTELMVVTGLSTIVVLVGARPLQDSFTTVKQVEIRTNIYQYYNTIVKNLYNNRAWTNTFNHPSNGDLYTCLRQTNPKSESDFDRCINFDDTAAGTRDDINLGFLLHLRDSSDQTLVDFNQAGQGFSKDGVTCNSFNAGAPDESCPFRVRVFWRLRCADRLSQGGTTCRHPSVELSVVTENSSAPDRLGKLRVSSFQDTIIKDAQKMQDPITILCDSVGATYDDTRGRCLQDFPNDTCPAGFYVTGIRADGTLICVDPTPECYFSVVPETADETDGNKNIQVDLSRTTSNTVSVTYQITGASTATGGGVDYTLNPTGTIVFLPSTPFQNIPVVIEDDVISEGNETIEFDLISATNCNIGTPASNTLTIIDDDGSPEVGFQAPAASSHNDSSSSTIQLTVEVAPTSTSPITVNYGVTAGTATSGTDFSLGGGSLNIPPLTPSANISFNIIGDAISEGVETATITLNSPSGAALKAGAESYVVTLTDSLPTVQFGAPSASVDETNGNTDIEVTLTPTAATPVSVNCVYNSTGSSANIGADLNFSNQVITFAPGDGSENCSFTALDDGTGDPDETGVFELNTPSGALIGAPSSYTVTLTETCSSPSWGFVSIVASSSIPTCPGSIPPTGSCPVSDIGNQCKAVHGIATGVGTQWEIWECNCNLSGGAICGSSLLAPGEACCPLINIAAPLGVIPTPFNPTTHCCTGTAIPDITSPACGGGAPPVCTNCPYGSGDNRILQSTHPNQTDCTTALGALGPGAHSCYECGTAPSGTPVIWQLWRDTGTPQVCL